MKKYLVKFILTASKELIFLEQNENSQIDTQICSRGFSK